MSNYNLSDNVQDNFEFEIRGKKFQVRYPRTEEIESIQEINARLEEAQTKKDTAATKSTGKEMEDFMYGLITPVGHDMPIEALLKTENIKVLKNFNTMIRTELSI